MKILGFFIRLPGSNRAPALGWLGRRPPAFFSPSASLSLPLRPVFLVVFVYIKKVTFILVPNYISPPASKARFHRTPVIAYLFLFLFLFFK